MRLVFIFFGLFIMFSCSGDDEDCCPQPNNPKLVIKLKFNPNQERLGNLGQPVSVPPNHAALSPDMKKMSANYIEFAPSPNTLLGQGEIIFQGEKTTAGGDEAIDFNRAIFAGNNETFLEIPLSEVAVGTYSWVRVSLAYQEGDIQFLAQDGNEYTGTLASFVGYNTYISSFNLNNNTISVNANKLQGFWAFETLGYAFQGQAPEGATTVPNPLFDSSPVPQGSCVVTGQFENLLEITGNETNNITVTLSFSTNNSFEWTEVNTDGKYEPSAGEQLVDMGLRGLIPIVE